jgi:CBS domain-containing protein
VKAIRDLVRQTRVADLGSLPAPQLPPTATVLEALELLVRGRRGAIVVTEGSRAAGIFTERDVLVRIGEGLFTSAEARTRTPLRGVMSRPPITVGGQAALAEAIEIMVGRHCRHLVVVNRHGDLTGLVTTGDIVQFLTDQFPEETLNLPPRLRQQFRRREGG